MAGPSVPTLGPGLDGGVADADDCGEDEKRSQRRERDQPGAWSE
jgi:hypothetical protein